MGGCGGSSSGQGCLWALLSCMLCPEQACLAAEDHGAHLPYSQLNGHPTICHPLRGRQLREHLNMSQVLAGPKACIQACRAEAPYTQHRQSMVTTTTVTAVLCEQDILPIEIPSHPSHRCTLPGGQGKTVDWSRKVLVHPFLATDFALNRVAPHPHMPSIKSLSLCVHLCKRK